MGMKKKEDKKLTGDQAVKKIQTLKIHRALFGLFLYQINCKRVYLLRLLAV